MDSEFRENTKLLVVVGGAGKQTRLNEQGHRMWLVNIGR